MICKCGYDSVDNALKGLLNLLRFDIDDSLSIKENSLGKIVLILEIAIAVFSIVSLDLNTNLFLTLFNTVCIFKEISGYIWENAILSKRYSEKNDATQRKGKISTYDILLFLNFALIILFILIVFVMLVKTGDENYWQMALNAVAILSVVMNIMNSLLDEIAKIYGAEASIR